MKKKILFIFALLLTLSAFSQTRKPVLIIPDSTTAFGVGLPANSLVFDYGANRMWNLTASASGTDDLSGATKILLVEAGAGGDGNGIYDADGTIGANRVVTATDSLKLDGGNFVLNTLNSTGTSKGFLMRNTNDLNLFEMRNDGKFLLGFPYDNSDYLSVSGLRGAVLTGSSNGAFGLSNARPDGTNNTTADNTNFYFLTRNSLGNIVSTGGFFVRNRNITAGSEYSVMVINEAIQTENSTGTNGRTVISTRNRHTSGAGAGVLHVENRDQSTSTTTFLVDAFEQNTQIGFGLRSGSAGTSANTWNLRILNNHSFTYNFGQLTTGDADFRGGTESYVLHVDAGEDAVSIASNNPDNSAIFDINSTTKGFLPPRMTTAQRDAIVSPATGLIVFNTTVNLLQFYDGVSWSNVQGTL